MQYASELVKSSYVTLDAPSHGHHRTTNNGETGPLSRANRQVSFVLTLRLLIGALLLLCANTVWAQAFEPVPGLSFTMPYGAVDPLPQVLTSVSTTTNFGFTASVSTTSGGNWLLLNGATTNLVQNTPDTISVSISAAGLMAGTYTGKIVLTPGNNNISILTVPVTLTICSSNAAFFDNLPGGMTFSMLTSGSAPPPQSFQIRNAGTGTLTWTVAAATISGSGWLSVSSASGSGTGTVNVTANPALLPGAGKIAGTYLGLLTVQATGDTVTIPVSVTVGASVFRQANPLSFTMPYGSVNPLPQLLTVASTGSNFGFTASPYNAAGGSWLLLNGATKNLYLNTPDAILVGVSASGLAVGTYTGEVIVVSSGATESMVVPVTLTVTPDTSSYLDNLPGQISFSFLTGGNAPTPQPLQIRNAGTGTLNWTGSTNTADGGSWLSLSETSGTAPSSITVLVNPLNLPGGGSVAGTFTGEVILQTTNGAMTIPVCVTVGANVFQQANPLNFTMPFGAVNPLPQILTIASTGSTFGFTASPYNAAGGTWLQLNGSTNSLYPNTPDAISVGVSAAGLAVGTYTAEVVVTSGGSNQSMTVPVTLTVVPATSAFFDNLPGQISFSFLTGGNTPTPQPLQIRSIGTGALDWSGATSTADGGNWLSLSEASGTAPSSITVNITSLNLPGGGKTAGTFTGQVVLQATGGIVTMPVSVTVGANVFEQANPLNFTMSYGSANPLPQLLTVASTGSNFGFSASPYNAAGGSWLLLNGATNNLYPNTPDAISVGVSASGLAVGTYTGEVVVTSGGSSQSMTVPVTLTIAPSISASFDNLPSGLSFFLKTGDSAPPAQSLNVRNAGTGTLNWTLTKTTSDGGNWLTASANSGTAPSAVTVGLTTLNLPGGGAIAGTYTGQIVLVANGDLVTIPVSVTVGANVFVSASALSFTQTYGGIPAAQSLSIASTGTNFGFTASPLNASGGAWLRLNSSTNSLYPNTPDTFPVNVSAVAVNPGIYTGEVLVSTSGMAQVVPVTLNVNSATAAPTTTFTPAAGTYSSEQTVTIGDSLPNATIYYTTDGTTPTTSSTVYSGPITVSSTETLKSFATATGYPNGAVASGLYTIVQTVATPNLSVQAGTYATAQSVTITDATSGATIYYTNDGSTPTTSSTKYTAAIAVSSSETIQAIAAATGYANSAVASAAYIITQQAATPTFSEPTGTYTAAQSVTISDSTTGVSIYYTTDGSIPTTSSTMYAAAIAVSSTETLKAIATATSYTNSLVATATYTITTQTAAAAPTFSPAAGSFSSDQSVTISDTTTGATIYYTTDGTTPTITSTPYTSAITVSTTETLEAIAVATGYTNSAVAVAAYNIASKGSPTFTVSGPAVSIVSGATTGNTSTISVTPGGGFTGNVTLTASITSSPNGAIDAPTLSFGTTSPVSIAGTTAGTATLTISTTAATSSALAYPKRPSVPWYSAGGTVVACILLFGIPAHRRRWGSLLGMVALLVTLASGMLACGGGGNTGSGSTGHPGTTAGAYVVTVTGTSGTTTSTATFALTLQ